MVWVALWTILSLHCLGNRINKLDEKILQMQMYHEKSLYISLSRLHDMPPEDRWCVTGYA